MRSIEKVVGIRLAGVLRRPAAGKKTWEAVLENLVAAKDGTEDGQSFARNYCVVAVSSLKTMPKSTMLEILQALHAKDGSENEWHYAKKRKTQEEACYFGHARTTAKANGLTVWQKNPWPSFWGDVPSGVRLCAKCYGAASRARRMGQRPKLPDAFDETSEGRPKSIKAEVKKSSLQEEQQSASAEGSQEERRQAKEASNKKRSRLCTDENAPT